MIRKQLHGDAAFSVVDCDGVRRLFLTVVPSRGVTLPEQIESALQTAQTLLCEQGSTGAIVLQTVFLKDRRDLHACRAIVEAFYGARMPATSYVVQPPCGGQRVAIEAWALLGPSDRLDIERHGDGLIIARHTGAAWTYLAGVTSDAAAPTYDRSRSAFRAAADRLASAGWRFDEVIRTWLHLGGITVAEGETDRYRELNRARADFYRNLTFGCRGRCSAPKVDSPAHVERSPTPYPASTGIGVDGDGLTIGCIALRSGDSSVAVVSLENPLQTAAYDYGHQAGGEPPMFSRAMAIVTGESVALLISGTASITAAESRHSENAEQQTRQTLTNIEALIASENLRRSGLPGVCATLDDLALVRVYIKRAGDYEIVRAVCQARLGDSPTLFVLADVCRPELLVEIEAVAFGRE
ncbi:MAG: dioxygenase [Thermoguttaceae bacterium]